MNILDYTWCYCHNPFDDEPIMDINQSIGVDLFDGSGINGIIFAKEITMLDSMGKKRINIYINSPGGNVKDGYTIFSSILRCKTETCGYVAGVAASIAGVILQACDYKVIYSFSTYMIHNPAFAGEDISAEEDPILKLVKTSLMDMLKTSKLSKMALSKLMTAETWMTPEEALDYGFVDEIMDINAEVEAVELEYIMNNKSEMINIVNKFNLVENSVKDNIKNKNKQLTMIEKLKKLLDLADTATDKEVENALKTAFPSFGMNAFSTNEKPAGYSTLKNDKDMDDDCYNDDGSKKVMNDDDMDGDVMDYKENPAVVDGAKGGLLPTEFTNLTNEIKSLRKEVAMLKNVKANELINKAIDLGKIKDSESKVWLNLATISYEDTKLALDSMSVTKSATSLVNTIDAKKSAEFIAEKKDALNKSHIEELATVTNGTLSWDNIDFNVLHGNPNVKKTK